MIDLSQFTLSLAAHILTSHARLGVDIVNTTDNAVIELFPSRLESPCVRLAGIHAAITFRANSQAASNEG